MKITAYWYEDEEDDNNSGFEWACPHCGEINSIGDDFVWNGKEGKHKAKYTYCCEHCDSEEEHELYRE